MLVMTNSVIPPSYGVDHAVTCTTAGAPNFVCYRLGGFAKYEPTDVAGTCRAAGGDFGGGSETLVCTKGSSHGNR